MEQLSPPMLLAGHHARGQLIQLGCKCGLGTTLEAERIVNLHVQALEIARDGAKKINESRLERGGDQDRSSSMARCDQAIEEFRLFI